MVRAMNSSWSTAVSATLHCLTGCAIGEVLGMVLSTWWGWGNTASILLSVVLAFFFGYLLTFSSVRRHGVSTREGVRLALASDTVSITRDPVSPAADPTTRTPDARTAAARRGMRRAAMRRP